MPTSSPSVSHTPPASPGMEGLLEMSPPAVVSWLIDQAIKVGASDLFLSCEQEDWSVTLRHLGVIRPACRLPLAMGRHCVSHLRAEANMDIAEHHHPHDGRCVYRTANGKQIDIRICSLPTLHGEDLALRLLDRESSLLSLNQIGLLSPDDARMERLLGYPGGLLLFTGPTGSGKTTTMYACLQFLNDGHRRIHTIEDPIEYTISGLHQSQVNAKQGIHFPDLLRGIIRQGPDVIMIGEIRDPETAKTAVNAANSGHLVLATLHASVAAGSVQSMLAFDVSPHFLATSLIGAVSQRLVRTFCPECRFPIIWDDDNPAPANGLGEPQFSVIGCPACHQTGFRGRTAVFEILEVSPTIRGLIQTREPAQVIEEQAYMEGMTGFLHSAQALVARGVTNFQEVSRSLPPESLRGHDQSGKQAGKKTIHQGGTCRECPCVEM
jgi:general secretion pathway protein E